MADNFQVRIDGAFPSGDKLHAAMSCMADERFWADPDVAGRLLQMRPEYRLSKFRRALPGKWSMEMTGAYLLDVRGTLEFLRAPAAS